MSYTRIVENAIHHVVVTSCYRHQVFVDISFVGAVTSSASRDPRTTRELANPVGATKFFQTGALVGVDGDNSLRDSRDFAVRERFWGEPEQSAGSHIGPPPKRNRFFGFTTKPIETNERHKIKQTTTPPWIEIINNQTMEMDPMRIDLNFGKSNMTFSSFATGAFKTRCFCVLFGS